MAVKSLEGFGGTVYFEGPDFSEKIMQLLQFEIFRLEKKFSRFIPDSELNNLNKNLHQKMLVDDEFWALFSAAKKLEIESGGSFNIATKEILESWGYDADYNLGESFDFSFSGKSFDLDLENKTVYLYNQIDFGSFGKGYFLDQAEKILASKNIENYKINAGGDLVLRNFPQKIYFEDPRNPKLAIGEAEVDNLFMASSSPLRRRWKSKHHLINPLNQKPADLMLAVYVQTETSGLSADALSTALFAMGFEKAQDFLSENDDLETCLISEKGSVWKTPGFLGTLYSTTS